MACKPGATGGTGIGTDKGRKRPVAAGGKPAGQGAAGKQISAVASPSAAAGTKTPAKPAAPTKPTEVSAA
jgi:hypothetical protein